MRAVLQLKSMKEGDIVTKEHLQAIRHFFGKILDSIKEVKVPKPIIETEGKK